jgi:hypothetical protein
MEIIDNLKDKQACIFGYYVDGILKGFRADSFGTLSLTNPKIYYYTKEQVETIRKNTQYELSNSGTKFMKYLLGGGEFKGQAMSTQGQAIDNKSVIDQVSKTEQEKRNWGHFEVRVLPFIPYEEGYTYPEKWKVEAALKSLEEPLEVLQFMTVEHEN